MEAGMADRSDRPKIWWDIAGYRRISSDIVGYRDRGPWESANQELKRRVEMGEIVKPRAPESSLLRSLLLLAAVMLFVSHAGKAAAQDRGAIARGRYLVEWVAVCGDCHTPTIDGKLDRAHWLEGAPFGYKPPPGFATIAPPIAGLPAGWSKEQTVRFLETGIRPDGARTKPPMPAYRLNPEDATAVAGYLQSLRKSP
jgi:mono/diheme cytochrome c family protein